MASSKRTLVWIAGVLGLLLLGAILLVNVLLSPERVRLTLVPVLEEALQRQITIDRVDIGLFSGIVAEDITIRDPESGDPLLAARKAVLRYQLWPLLQKRIVIDQVRLDSPELSLYRQADGGLYTFISGQDEGEGAETKAGADPAGGAAAEGSGLDLLVTEVAISDGRLLFIDQKLNPEAPFRYQVDRFSLKAERVSLADSFPLEIAGELDGAAFRLQGSVNLDHSDYSFKAVTEHLNLAAFAPYFREALPGIFSRAELNLALDVAISERMLAMSGDVSLDNVHLVLDALKDWPLRDASLAAQLDLQADLAERTLTLGATRLRYNQIPLVVEGTVTGWDARTGLDLQVAVDKLKLRDAIASLPAAVTAGTNGLDPAGTISLQGRLQGRADQDPLTLLSRATLELDAVQGNLGAFRPSLSGPVALGGTELSASGLRLSIGDNQALVDFSVPDYRTSPYRLEAALQAERLDLDALLKGSAAPAPTAPQAGQNGSASQADSEERGPYDLPIEARGTLKVAALTYRGVVCEKIDAAFRLENNRLHLDPLTGRLGTGSFETRAQLDLAKKGLDYQGDLRLVQIPAGPLLKTFAPNLEGVAAGAFDLQTTLRGAGSRWETAKQKLVAEGNAAISGLSVSKLPVVTELANFLQIDELKTIAFETAQTTFKVEEGNLRLDGSFASPQVTISPKGVVGLDGGLNVSLPTALAPPIAAKLGNQRLTGLFVNQAGWTELPLKLKGTVKAPDFKLDEKQLRSKAVDTLIKQVVPQPSEGKEVDPKKKLLEDALKGLLGR